MVRSHIFVIAFIVVDVATELSIMPRPCFKTKTIVVVVRPSYLSHGGSQHW